MHMSDALVSPAVGIAAWVTTAALMGTCARKIHLEADEQKAPLMGVAAAFVFASQMLNFAIPLTGSSGHLSGGLILAILLGPYAAFLAMASVLTVQALFFADGGLLALGCNILNMGLFTCFIAYPLIFKPIAGRTPSPLRLTIAAGLSSVIGIELGALGVVLQTTASGITELPFASFAMVLLPIQLVISLIEAAATAAVAVFLLRTRPDMILRQAATETKPLRVILIPMAATALLIGFISIQLASNAPDGLEWAILKTAGDTNFTSTAGTSLSGFVGGAAILLLALLIAVPCRISRCRKSSAPGPAGR